MFKRYERRGHVLLQFIPSLGIYTFCLIQFSPRRSMNREGFSRRDRSSTVGSGFFSMFNVMPIDKGTHQGKLCSKNLDEAFCILKVTGVLIEKTLKYIFSKIQLFEIQPCADPESYVRGGPTLTLTFF